MPVTADQARHLSALVLGVHGNTVRGAHTLRAGVDYQRFPVSENFFFGVTDPAFNDPGSDTYIETLRPFDLSRGGRRFLFSDRKSGSLKTAFAQDTIRLARLTLSLGLRYDLYGFLVHAAQWQPRLGLAFAIPETGTAFRLSYNRLFQLPPNENLLLSSSDESGVLVPPERSAALGGAVRRIRPERQNFYEAGVQQALGRHLGLNLSVYHKDAKDQQDNDNFLNTGVIFPTSLASIRVNGLDLRLTLAETHGFSGAVSVSHARAVTTPPFTGGLFLGSDAVRLLSAGPFIIDHDQALGLQTNLRYARRSGLWTAVTVRHDSGLVTNRSDPAEVANDPDYSDLLPFVNLLSDTPRVRPRTITDLAAGYDRTRDGRRRWTILAQVSNVSDAIALYNFQSVFVGTRIVAPRTWGVRMRWYW
ncbi:MAG: TonB-dependent receptor [Bryobacteraceae bacterium]|nr:TonB-dependent receptor [Bryobacteraceae bacterium]